MSFAKLAERLCGHERFYDVPVVDTYLKHFVFPTLFGIAQTQTLLKQIKRLVEIIGGFSYEPWASIRFFWQKKLHFIPDNIKCLNIRHFKAGSCNLGHLSCDGNSMEKPNTQP